MSTTIWEGKIVGEGCISVVGRTFSTDGFSGNGAKGQIDKSLLIGDVGESMVVIGKIEILFSGNISVSMGDLVESFVCISSSTVMQGNGTTLTVIKLFWCGNIFPWTITYLQIKFFELSTLHTLYAFCRSLYPKKTHLYAPWANLSLCGLVIVV